MSNEFTTEFNPLPMKGDPMRISLKPNAIPKKVTGARRVPVRHEEGADTVVQVLMNKKVIVTVSTTADWCSPAFFVPKADMIRVRLVTDLHTLTNMSSGQFTLFHAHQRYYKQSLAQQHASQNWTPFMATSSWHWNPEVRSLRRFSSLKAKFDISEPPWALMLHQTNGVASQTS